jgi:glycosidase
LRKRPVIYQLFVRLFGNRKGGDRLNGTLATNGCGKFNDIDERVLLSLKEMGFTHLWLTGVLDQASGTSHPHRPADDPALLKGIAGSPYAIRDYFDVSADYAVDPARRREEFRELVDRCHAYGMGVFIDLVPNHVARSYRSQVRPDLSFGEEDDPTVFFARDNHFFYLRPGDPGGGPPLRLPTTDAPCEKESLFGRVTGNNQITWSPSIHDWYETVKLNYGHDFTTGRDTSHLPGADASIKEVPRTWRVMDEVIAYWQGMGVDGFRVDMAHMIPVEFWRWSLKRCRERNPAAYIFGEAYDSDPMKLTSGDVLEALLEAGFDAVYDHPMYKTVKAIYESGAWANDLDSLTFSPTFHRVVRYAENHDEVRIASPLNWGGVGMAAGRPATAVLHGMGRGPVMIYNGQEVGEPALAKMGFGGGDGRTSIFDYGRMPEMVKWQMGSLTLEQQDLREWYGKLLRLMGEPAFTRGDFYGLNHANKENPFFGRIDDEAVSGHWLYAFLRRDAETGQAFLIAANFHPTRVLEGVRIRIPSHAREWLGVDSEGKWQLVERLEDQQTIAVSAELAEDEGVGPFEVPALSARIFEFQAGNRR